MFPTLTQKEFIEMYEQRSLLFLALMKAMQSSYSFRSRLNSHGSSLSLSDAWFIAGTDLGNGQITYSLPIEMWDLADFLPERKFDPECKDDPQTVCDRLRDLLR